MSNYDPNASAPGFPANGATAIDVGFRAFMLRGYNYMAAGVGLTGVAAFLTYQFTGPELSKSADVGVHAGAGRTGVLYQCPNQHVVGGVFPLRGPCRDFIVDHLPHL